MRGYTLIELLIVVLLLGLLATLALPRLTTLYNSTLAAYERDEVLQRIAELSYLAFSEGRNLELAQYPSPDPQALPLKLPDGWQAMADPPIRYRANGVCMGGMLQLNYRDQNYTLRLEPPLCRPDLL